MEMKHEETSTTYSELLDKLENVVRQIDEAREREARLLAARVMEVLAESGVDVDELLKIHRSGRQPTKRVSPRYWNPETGETWAGRGKRPNWMKGQDPERFLIGSGEKNPVCDMPIR